MTPALAAALPAFLMCNFVQAITPGPANLCALATTMRFGIRPALRQWVGLVLGLFAVGLVVLGALRGAEQAVKGLMPVLSVLGAAYVLWLAWTIVRPGEDGHGFADARPSVGSGVMVQVTNVKLLVMSSATLLAYVFPYTSDAAVLVAAALVQPAIGGLCSLLWIFGGARLRSRYEQHSRLIDILMAAALAFCALSMLTAIFPPA